MQRRVRPSEGSALPKTSADLPGKASGERLRQILLFTIVIGAVSLHVSNRRGHEWRARGRPMPIEHTLEIVTPPSPTVQIAASELPPPFTNPSADALAVEQHLHDATAAVQDLTSPPEREPVLELMEEAVPAGDNWPPPEIEHVLISDGRPVTSSVRGNLGPASVITSTRVDDWYVCCA